MSEENIIEDDNLEGDSDDTPVRWIKRKGRRLIHPEDVKLQYDAIEHMELRDSSLLTTRYGLKSEDYENFATNTPLWAAVSIWLTNRKEMNFDAVQLYRNSELLSAISNAIKDLMVAMGVTEEEALEIVADPLATGDGSEESD